MLDLLLNIRKGFNIFLFIKYPLRPSFPHLRMHQNQPESLSKHRSKNQSINQSQIEGLETQRFWLGGLLWVLKICILVKFPSDADTTGQWTTFGITLLQDKILRLSQFIVFFYFWIKGSFKTVISNCHLLKNVSKTSLPSMLLICS